LNQSVSSIGSLASNFDNIEFDQRETFNCELCGMGGFSRRDAVKTHQESIKCQKARKQVS